MSNISNERDVKKAKIKEKDIRSQEIKDLRYVLESEQGRRFLWRLMAECKTFSSIWETSAKIHYNAGQQDLGHFLMAEIIEANENSFMQMMKENKKEN